MSERIANSILKLDAFLWVARPWETAKAQNLCHTMSTLRAKKTKPELDAKSIEQL